MVRKLFKQNVIEIIFQIYILLPNSQHGPVSKDTGDRVSIQ